MNFEQNKLEGSIVNFADLDEMMKEEGFDAQWDYERITYDYKIVDQVKNEIYYFRIPALVHTGEIPNDSAQVKMYTPYLGKHYYPHGVEYDEVFPERIVEKCSKKLDVLFDKIKEITVV
ncbi:YugN family protein [Alkalicoccus urumqiensis]|uniref:YugN-like family protein n=1 Tax=Alkalicoccus urumqiensis TaxID=1548213 RepID=A0A2P6MEN8_ALKUR|nr:YugN family protein [Alkalicoccus urumqiensis]PRO64748.1 hypothetical protein C6I21_12615 [Alkalicoccus urumqiensis]